MRRPRRAILLLLGGMLVASFPAAAADAGLPVDQVARLVFPPNLVIRHQREIGLTPEQRQALIAEMQRTQSDLVPLEIELGETAAELGALLAAPRVDEARALDLTARVLELEGRIKHRRMALLVRIKNRLTDEQQMRLRRLRRLEAARRHDGG